MSRSRAFSDLTPFCLALLLGCGMGEVSGELETPDTSSREVASSIVGSYGKCGARSRRAVFVSEVAPPATLAPGSTHSVSVTFANCSGVSWRPPAGGSSRGHKLGSQAPQDNTVWGRGRVPLPAEVRHNQQVTLGFAITAPRQEGNYGYQWAILEENVAWILNQASPLHTIRVARSREPAVLCPGVTVLLGGEVSASAALQRCIDATPSGALLELPAGTYLMTGPVIISRAITLRTKGTTSSTVGCLQPGAPACAVLRAAPDLVARGGFLQIGSSAKPVSGVIVEHLVLDGNRAARLSSSAARDCASGTNRAGFNALARGERNSFSYSASINALCGSGLEWRGHRATLVGNLFQGNGEHAKNMMWADGLTIHEADSSVVSGNRFVDNSDVDLILGGGRGTMVQDNTVLHKTNATFAGLMLDNFNGSTSGDFTGAVVSGNSVDCGAYLCGFGINLGPHPWYVSRNTIGGEVHGNSVRNGKICLNIDGAGTSEKPIAVYGNQLSRGAGSQNRSFVCRGTKLLSTYNIGPDSVVDRRGDQTPVTTSSVHECPTGGDL